MVPSRPQTRLGALIDKWRAARGLTMTDLAKRSGLSEAGLYNLKSGKTNPQRRSLQRLAAALDVPLIDLWEAAQEDTRPQEDSGELFAGPDGGVWLLWARGIILATRHMTEGDREQLRQTLADFVEIQARRAQTVMDDGETDNARESGGS
jgi:transcriptional regulator with XRE-family HTH domain